MPSNRTINFVKESRTGSSDGISQDATVIRIRDEPKTDWGELYAQVAFPTGRPDASTPSERSQNEDQVMTVMCSLCEAEVLNNDEGKKAHASSIVHQLALGASSRPPAAIDRRSKGLKMMERYGYDADERMGLGAEGEGMSRPIQVKERRKRAALGSNDEYKKVIRTQEATKVVKKTKGEKRAARKEELAAGSRKHDQWYDELFGK